MVWTIIAVLFWMLAGALVAVICEAIRGRRIMKSADPVVFGLWLGKACTVEFDGDPRKCVVTAVSWKGAVSVRGTDGHPRKSVWIPKEAVPERVRWDA